LDGESPAAPIASPLSSTGGASGAAEPDSAGTNPAPVPSPLSSTGGASGAAEPDSAGTNPAPVPSPSSTTTTTGGASGAAEADSSGTNLAGYIQAAQTGRHLATQVHNQVSGAVEDTP
jgi:hypothetical protein